MLSEWINPSKKNTQTETFFLAERDLKTFAESEVDSIGNQWTVQQIERIVTADNLCSCKDPIDMVFMVSKKWNSNKLLFLSCALRGPKSAAVQIDAQKMFNYSEKMINST